MFLSYVTIWYPLGFRLNTIYGEKSSMIVQGLPHACGGVSWFKSSPASSRASSPRMWGCFWAARALLAVFGVFPTHVGVFPNIPLDACREGWSSPRMWGCFSAWIFRPRRDSSLPHACGGVSSLTIQPRFRYASSPRMWGCFRPAPCRRRSRCVFPTHVGVFLMGNRVGKRNDKSSPRMWGSFRRRAACLIRRAVFPTHVGVFPIRTSILAFITSLPHACGGVSYVLCGDGEWRESSPRMWGQFSSRTTYQRRAFHALGHIQQELRDGQAPRTPDLEKPFQTIPPPGILLGGHAGSPARGRHGFKPCPFRRSGRG